MNQNQQSTLRYGVMCGPEGIPAFAAEIVRSLKEGSLAEPALLIVDAEPPARSSAATKIRKALRLQGNLWHLQSKVFPLREMPAYRLSNLDSILQGVPRINCQVEYKGKYSQY